jgi:hypothetical protein
VSLPWRKTVRLRVAASAVCGRLEQGLGRKLLAEATHAADEQALAIDAVLAELGLVLSLQGLRLDIELADTLVHLDVVEGDFSGNSERQLQAVATACVAELLGEAAEQHDIRWQLQADGRHLLIGAIAKEQIHVLAEAATRHHLKLRSIQPDFCLQWNRHASALKPGAGVFAVACGREAVVACVQQGAVAAISSGAWLDQSDAPGATSVGVKRLMCGFGLDSSTTTGVLDTRVGRLLSSLGRDAADQSSYLLVAPDVSQSALSSRWTVLNREGDAS